MVPNVQRCSCSPGRAVLLWCAQQPHHLGAGPKLELAPFMVWPTMMHEYSVARQPPAGCYACTNCTCPTPRCCWCCRARVQSFHIHVDDIKGLACQLAGGPGALIRHQGHPNLFLHIGQQGGGRTRTAPAPYAGVKTQTRWTPRQARHIQLSCCKPPMLVTHPNKPVTPNKPLAPRSSQVMRGHAHVAQGAWLNKAG